MSKNRWWVIVLVAVLVLVVLAGAGYAIYRFGYAQGVQAGITGNNLPRAFDHDFLRNPMFGLRGFERGMMPFRLGVGGMMGFGWFGFILQVVIGAAVIILAVWLLYKLVKFLFGRQVSKVTVQSAPAVGKQETGDMEQQQK